MNNEDDKIANLKEKIENIEKNKQNKSQFKKESGASFGFKISTELVAALVVGVGIGIVVDNYFETKPLGILFKDKRNVFSLIRVWLEPNFRKRKYYWIE